MVPWEKDASAGGHCRVCGGALPAGLLTTVEHCRVCGRCICEACACSVPLAEFGIATTPEVRRAHEREAGRKLFDLSYHVTVTLLLHLVYYSLTYINDFVRQLEHFFLFFFWRQVCKGRCLELAVPDGAFSDNGVARLMAAHAELSKAIAETAYLAPGLQRLIDSNSSQDMASISPDEVRACMRAPFSFGFLNVNFAYVLLDQHRVRSFYTVDARSCDSLGAKSVMHGHSCKKPGQRVASRADPRSGLAVLRAQQSKSAAALANGRAAGTRKQRNNTGQSGGADVGKKGRQRVLALSKYVLNEIKLY